MFVLQALIKPLVLIYLYNDFKKVSLTSLEYPWMGKFLVGIGQGFSVQPNAILLDEATTFTLAGNQLAFQEYIQHGLPTL